MTYVGDYRSDNHQRDVHLLIKGPVETIIIRGTEWRGKTSETNKNITFEKLNHK
jgi:hypothetical protein